MSASASVVSPVLGISCSQPSITSVEIAAVEEVLRSGWITQGRKVLQFESEFSGFVGLPYGVACSSGTAALHLALVALGIRSGDEVLVPDISFVATTNAVRYCGAVPVLCDIDADTWCMSLEDAKAKLTRRTKAAIAVHLYGKRCDVEGLKALNVPIVEDAAQAIGLEDLGKHSACATFSFYGNKVITTGEGGMVVTHDRLFAERCIELRGHAMHHLHRYFHTRVGFNYRMTDMQAALGLAQLSRVAQLLEKRRAVVSAYHQVLHDRHVCTAPADAPWLFTALFQSKDRAALTLAMKGIETRPCFVPMHQLPMYAAPTWKFSRSGLFEKHALSLPTYPDLTTKEAVEIAGLCRGL